MCVCVREREREGHSTAQLCVCVCVCVCVWERGRERVTAQHSFVCVCVCVCVREETWSHHNRSLCANTYQLHHCVCHVTLFPSLLELMLRLRTLLTVFTFILKAKVCDYGKGSYISDAACGAWPITMHWVSWPIRADCACQEGLCRKTKRLKEAGHRGPTIMYSIWKIMCFFFIKACQHILLHQIMIF